ncbi:hypothetical protein HHK36_022044 [Tetracentron sinense]|uniref:Uncharacterized protein n=1 Tax=Tetracentron sinense TaxID=13715 RepID=A0A834YQ52_TETSI|nr:hypothetical protein HHK36_022044 [Tetracentron sinense]
MRNSKGDTALHIAARAGHFSVVKILVEKSRDVQGGRKETNNILIRIQNKGKNTVLHEALRCPRSDVVKMLTEKDPELWCFVNEAGESPLYLAVKGGLTEIAREVLQSSHTCSRRAKRLDGITRRNYLGRLQ